MQSRLNSEQPGSRSGMTSTVRSSYPIRAITNSCRSKPSLSQKYSGYNFAHEMFMQVKTYKHGDRDKQDCKNF